MDNTNATRIKLLKIMEILTQETDEEHPMSSNALIEKLEEMGISCTRKTLYRDIETLNEYGYEVLTKRGKSNEYWVEDRSFNVPELHIMLDAVQAASFIPKAKTKELVGKIAALAGSKRSEVLKQNIVEFNLTKNSNEAIYYSVNEIVNAIRKKKQIIFLYFDYDCNHKRVYRREGHHYLANPCATVFSEGHYYLLSYDSRYNKMSHYRIDRMEKVEMLESDAVLPIEEYGVGKHKKQMFGMFTGETERVKFNMHRSLIDVVFDTFGDSVRIKPEENDLISFSAEVQVSPIFFGWCCSFGDKLKVVSPNSVVEELRNYTKSISEQYE